MKCYNPTSFTQAKNVSIQLPNYTIQEKAEEQSSAKKLLPVLLMALSFIAGYLISSYYTNNSNQSIRVRNTVLEDINTENKNQISQQKTELSILKTEKKIKDEAILQLQDNLKTSINSFNTLKSDVNFYERLLSPDTENKGLRVFETKINQQTKNAYQLKITIVQKIEKAKSISGSYQIKLIGKLKGKAKTIQINKKNESNYKFKYFHHLSLLFSIPEGFNAEQLVVKLFPKNKRSKIVEYTVNWNSSIKK